MYIREIKKEDLPQVRQLLTSLSTDSAASVHSIWDEYQRLRKVNATITMVMVEEIKTIGNPVYDSIVATASVIAYTRLNGRQFYQIEDVVCHENYRDKGCGKWIIEELIKWCKKEGGYKIILNCAEHNIDFYKKCGFHEAEHQMRLDI